MNAKLNEDRLRPGGEVIEEETGRI